MNISFQFLKKRSILQRLDIFPFLFLQLLLSSLYFNKDLNNIVKSIIFFSSILLQLIVFFSKFWSEKLRSSICYKQVSSIEKSDYVRVDLVNKQYKINDRTEICKVIRLKELVLIEFGKVNYLYDFDLRRFVKSKYDLNKTVKDLCENVVPYCDGTDSTDSLIDIISNLKLRYGINLMKIPIPSFFQLYKEHIVAPFFVFQLFCISLWILDDYGLSSATTLSMLCFFEATVVGQRIMNLITLRKLRNPPHYIYVYRNKKWDKVSSVDIVPGDIISVIPGQNNEICKEPDQKEENNVFFINLLNKLKEAKKKAEERKGVKSVDSVLNTNKEKTSSPLTCDCIILSGSVIVNESMLTGESIPQMKEAFYKFDDKLNLKYDPFTNHKLCTLFAGTTIITAERDESLPSFVTSAPPNKGAVCLVTKTGFNTSQGKILKTVMFTQDKNQGESKEAFIFIFILLCIALYASYLVFIEGIEREGEVTHKLLLRCIIIITNAVPAELPIELSLAINNSLLYLQSKKIVCIEPFRIPFAGKVDICCFDKTGTLTKDEFILKGIAVKANQIKSATEVDENVQSVLLGCNSLLSINSKVVGDPIELVSFKGVGGSIINSHQVENKSGMKIFIEKRYAFDSTLKRMSVLTTVVPSYDKSKRSKRVLSKGAPEMMKKLYKSIPDDYDSIANSYALKGYRILSIGYRDDDSLSLHSLREEIEKEHVFLGFVIVETPLKSDTSKYINELMNADLECLIITGDHYLTTTKVALDLNIGPSKVVFMEFSKENHVKIVDLEEKVIKTIELNDDLYKKVLDLTREYMIGINGNHLVHLENLHMKNKQFVYRNIKLFCRVSPTQKDQIISQLIEAGCNPSMCGDGSNDVGALKKALVGVALLNSEDNKNEKPDSKAKETNFSILSFDEEEGIKSGDVTAAAPFTSKSGSIKCMKNIFIRGRCTLTITFQMFKILALNCFLSAYCLSILALKGIKFSDFQTTVLGFITAFLFLMLSKGEPLKKLNKNKPQLYFFTLPSVISIVFQAVSHIVSLHLIIKMTETYDPIHSTVSKSFDEKYSPTLINTVVFIYISINNVSNFLVNYIGEPFMENLSKNTWMQRLCFGVWVGVLVCVFDLYPELNEYFEMLPLPDEIEYKIKFVGMLLFDLVFSYFVENWKKIFKMYK